jgi:hypothetical protein
MDDAYVEWMSSAGSVGEDMWSKLYGSRVAAPAVACATLL